MAEQTLKFTVVGHGDAEGIERLAQSIDDLVSRLRRLDRTDASANVDVDTRKAEQKIGEFARDLRRKIREAVTALPDIELNADSSDAQREIAEIRAELLALHDARIGVDIDAADARRQVQDLQQRLTRLATKSPNVAIKTDAAAAAAKLAAFSAQVDRLDGRNVRVRVSTIGVGSAIAQLGRFGNSLRGVGIAAAALSAVGALPQIVGIGSALVQLSGVLALLPAVAVTAAVGIGTLVLGFQNLGDALGPTDTAAHLKKVNEALAKLSPSARVLVSDLRGLGGAWNSVRLDVQERLFQGVGKAVQDLAGRYLPPLRSMLVGTAAGFNSAFVSSAEFLAQQPTVQKLSTAFDQVRQALVNASGAARPLTEAFVSLVSVGASRLPQLGQAITNVATKFRDWVTEAERSGDLGRIIDRSITAIQQLGRIAINIGSSLGGLFRAADSAGVNFLGTVERITGEIRTFINSAQGQAVIVGFFRSISDTVTAAMPGIKAIGQAIADLVVRLSNSGVLTGIAATFSAIAIAAAPLLGTLGNLASVVLPPLLGLMQGLAPVLVPVAVGLLAISAAARGLAVLQTLGTSFAGFAGGVRAAEGGIGKFRTAMSGMASFMGAGGPWGLAIAAALVGIGLLIGAFQGGQQAAEDQKAAIDGLKGTLDQLSGAVTQQTITQKAQELSTKKLADGSKTYLQAVKELGISTVDYTQASLGNAEAIGRVRTQLDAHVKSLITATPAYATGRQELAAMGLTLDDLAAAAQGNGPALEKVNGAVDRFGAGAPDVHAAGQLLIDTLLGAGGASAELARELGISQDQLAQAQQAVRDAAEASGQLAQQLGLVGAAFAAVPDQKTVTVQSLSQPAQDQLTALGLTVEQLPDNKGIKITAPTDEAKANLTAFLAGVQGASADVTINGNSTPAQTAFNAILGAIQANPGGTIDINGNPMPASAALSFALGLISSSTGTVKINGEPTPVQTVLSAVISAITTGNPDVTIGGASGPVDATLQAVIQAVTGANPELTFVPQTAQADAARAGAAAPIQAPVDVGAPTTDSSGPTKATAGAPVQAPVDVGSPTTDSSGPTRAAAATPVPVPVTIGSPVDSGPVDAGKAAAQQPTRSLHTIDVDDKPVVDAKARAVQPTRSLHTIDVNDNAVTDAKRRAQQPTHSTHTITVVVNGAPIPRAFGAYTQPRAEGAYATPYAAGGMRKMSAARAEIVPPRQPRIIGDRQVGDEAFIPVNGSARSQSILQTTASRMGFDLVPSNGSATSRASAGMMGPLAALSVRSTVGGDGGALLAAVGGLRRELRDLRGDVDHHSDNIAIVAELRGVRAELRAVKGRSAGETAQSWRTSADLGAF